MALLSKKDYAEIYKNEEYNPKGLGLLIRFIAAIVIITVLILIIF